MQQVKLVPPSSRVPSLILSSGYCLCGVSDVLCIFSGFLKSSSYLTKASRESVCAHGALG